MHSAVRVAIVGFATWAAASAAMADTCRHLEFAELQSLSPQELTSYYVRLGDIKNAWWTNSDVNVDVGQAQAHECDLEADRVMRLAKHEGISAFRLMTAGAHTGILGTGVQ
ncbi:hypothetical protein [Burkholderia pseudomallei]|nr:hypothetical protein [Burkholderia pseudomallei]